MTPAAKLLLQKLLNGRPKPSESALKELFMGIKESSIEELIAFVKGRSDPEGKGPSKLEAEAKLKLRRIKGKASDFVPYLVDEIGVLLGAGRNLPISANSSLGSAIAAAERLLGSRAEDAYARAMAKYIEENDISYKLKRA